MSLSGFLQIKISSHFKQTISQSNTGKSTNSRRFMVCSGSVVFTTMTLCIMWYTVRTVMCVTWISRTWNYIYIFWEIGLSSFGLTVFSFFIHYIMAIGSINHNPMESLFKLDSANVLASNNRSCLIFFFITLPRADWYKCWAKHLTTISGLTPRFLDRETNTSIKTENIFINSIYI
jgi:hypothetical protein